MTPTGRVRGRSPALFLAAALALATGCETAPKIGPPASTTKTGDAQTATVGTAVPIAPSVTIMDAAGKGVPNLAVNFVVTSGGGTLTGGTTFTDANGVATTTSWVLGTKAGPNTLSVSGTTTTTAVLIPGLPSGFTAIGKAGPATTIKKLSVDPTSGPAGGNIDSVVVLVADQFDNPVAGETVTFAVTGGGGSISPATVVTSADGRAAARWTLGSAPATANSATATRSGLAAPTVTFNTTTVTAVSSVRFESNLLIVDSLATITPTVTAFGPSGAPIAGVGITLTSRNTNAATTSGGNVTGVRPGQTFLIAASVDNPNATDSALVIIANVAAPVITAAVPRYDLKADTTFTVSIIVDMRASSEKLGAATLQVTWDPALLTYVSNGGGTSGVNATINTSGAASGAISMAMASSAGFPGAVEIRTVTFRAAATTGRSGTLVVIPSELTGAGTFTDLRPRTVSASYPLKTR
jgi:hypothetical protein